jgi:pyridoxal phosphate enzyme (YggS family)
MSTIMSSLDDSLQARIAAVRARIAAAAHGAGRDPASIRLVAVSKSAGAEAVRAALASGQAAFGESYLQEAVAKIAAVRALAAEGGDATDGGLGVPAAPEWHFIGPIQSNKTRAIAEAFSWVQSLDRLAIAERLSAQRPLEQPPLHVLLQVNISGEATKGGVAPDALAPLATAVAALHRLRLRGLMAIPTPQSVAPVGAQFGRMRELFDDLIRRGFALDTLSLGMSSDLEAAVAAGSTMVRVGTAIFGPRSAP